MEIKKSKSADLEKQRPTLLLIGLIFSFGVVLQSFEWSKSEIRIKPVSSLEDDHLYEAITEVIISKPKPKVQITQKQTKRASKGPVIVKDETQKKEIKQVVKSKTKLQPNPNLKFNLKNDLPVDENDLISSIPKVDTFGFAAVEEKPEFEGGNREMMKFISKNVVYPSIARDNGKQGKVYISFIIDEDGNVTNVEIVKSVEKHLDKEALRVIKKMPKWRPGKQRGIPVKVKYTIPVNYTLKG